MRFDGIMLDLDHTVYDYYAAHTAALGQTVDWISETLNLPAQEVTTAYNRARKEIHAQLVGQASSHSRFLYFQRLAENLGFKPWLIAVPAEDKYWDSFLEHMIPRPGVSTFLDAIGDTPVAIVTDLTARIQFRKLAKLGLDGRVTSIVSSEEAGVEKPHRRIFELALNKLGTDASKSCMIGDNLEKDIKGATAFGLKSFWLKNGDSTEHLDDRVTPFESFQELTKLITSG